MAYTYSIGVPTGFDDDGNLVWGIDYGVKGYDNAAESRAKMATNASNMILAKYQNDWNIQQWERENEYNTPEAQRQRMLDAGMNPLYYSGELTNGNAQQPVESADFRNEAPSLNTNYTNQRNQSLLGAAGSLLEQKKLLIENKKADAEIKQLDASSRNLDEQATRYGFQNRLDAAQANRLQTLMQVDEATANKYASDIRVNNSLIDQNYANVRKMSQEQKLAYEKTITEQMTREYSIQKMRSEIGLNNAKIPNENETLKEIQARIKKIQTESALNGMHMDIGDLEYLEKRIELMWKDAGLEAEYMKNRSQIHSNLWGMLSPVVSMSSSLPGSADAQSFDNYVMQRGSNSNPTFNYNNHSPSYYRYITEQ